MFKRENTIKFHFKFIEQKLQVLQNDIEKKSLHSYLRFIKEVNIFYGFSLIIKFSLMIVIKVYFFIYKYFIYY